MDILRAKEPKTPKETVFTALADPALPPEERTLPRLEDEGFIVLGAGTDTTAYALSVILFHMLDNSEILCKLYDDIKIVMPEPSTRPPLSVLEIIPLLVSAPLHPHSRLSRGSRNDQLYRRRVINEGFRLSMGTFTRHPRVASDRVLQYKDWVIPARTSITRALIVGIFNHFDRISVVRSPGLFIWIVRYFPIPSHYPWRWIRAAERKQHLESNLVLFTKGTRVCLGVKRPAFPHRHVPLYICSHFY